MPFDLLDSRRLTGPNLLLDGPGAVLDVAVPRGRAEAAVGVWKDHLQRLLGAVGWSGAEVAHRLWEGGATLAFAAPFDVLYAATEVNEAAWAAAVAELQAEQPPRFEAEVERLRALIAEEARPALHRLAEAAAVHGATVLHDDDVSVGLGAGSKTWAVGEAPAPEDVDWQAIHDVPVALVTGTNGKSTTVRMLGAVAAAAGLTAGLTSTDTIAIGGETVDRGDYSGPGGARTALRDGRVEIGLLEVARGGILRRGLGVPRATAVAVTNVADDHLGDYGILSVEALAEAKFVVAKALGEGGTLVTNADDLYCAHEAHRLRPLLALRGATTCWTSLDPDEKRLTMHRRQGGPACAVVDGWLAYSDGGAWQKVVAVEAIPATLGGAARYNVRNALTVLGLARALGLPDAAVAEGLSSFTSDPTSNPGRGNFFYLGGARALVDFAHNPHGLDALFETVASLPAERRLVLLSHAGDRSDDDIAGVARSAARLGADRYLLADLPDYRRGRAPGEVPRLLAQTLQREGVAADAIERVEDPVAATRRALDWARAGDLLVLLVLSRRDEALALVQDAAAAATA